MLSTDLNGISQIYPRTQCASCQGLSEGTLISIQVQHFYPQSIHMQSPKEPM